MDTVFKALSDPSRRELLDQLYERDGQTLTELERRFAVTRFAVMKHLRVLEEAGLVVTRKVGREKLHYLNAVPIRQIHDRWIGKFQEAAASALIGLKATLEEEPAMPTVPDRVFQIFIKTNPEELWKAITESDFTTRYYFSSTVESSWKPGASLEYRIGEDLAIVGEVVECEPPRRLVTTFDARWDDEVAGDPPSRISWEIEPMGPVCKLTVVHDGFEGLSATYHQVDGMALILSGLKTLLETGAPLMPAAAS